MMMLVVVDVFFISYVYKSKVYLKQCCNMTSCCSSPAVRSVALFHVSC